MPPFAGAGNALERRDRLVAGVRPLRYSRAAGLPAAI